eukprot:3609983-Amphidinium_carterae.1
MKLILTVPEGATFHTTFDETIVELNEIIDCVGLLVNGTDCTPTALEAIERVMESKTGARCLIKTTIRQQPWLKKAESTL